MKRLDKTTAAALREFYGDDFRLLLIRPTWLRSRGAARLVRGYTTKWQKLLKKLRRSNRRINRLGSRKFRAGMRRAALAFGNLTAQECYGLALGKVPPEQLLADEHASFLHTMAAKTLAARASRYFLQQLKQELQQ